MTEDFAENLGKILRDAMIALDSALLSDDFLSAADQSLGEIPNLVGVHKEKEANGDKADPS
jgi:hypothetical protein